MKCRFEIRDGVLVALDDTGIVVHRRPPVATRIVQVLHLAEHLIVREDYFHFPEGKSNLYCVDADLNLVWSAQLPGPSDIYANPVTQTAAGLVCAARSARMPGQTVHVAGGAGAMIAEGGAAVFGAHQPAELDAYQHHLGIAWARCDPAASTDRQDCARIP